MVYNWLLLAQYNIEDLVETIYLDLIMRYSSEDEGFKGVKRHLNDPLTHPKFFTCYRLVRINVEFQSETEYVEHVFDREGNKIN